MSAQLSAALRASDSARLSYQTLRESSQLAATQLSMLQQEVATLDITSTSPASVNTAPSATAAGTAAVSRADGPHEVARLRAQLVVQNKEMARLKDKLLETQQVRSTCRCTRPSPVVCHAIMIVQTAYVL